MCGNKRGIGKGEMDVGKDARVEKEAKARRCVLPVELQEVNVIAMDSYNTTITLYNW